jgi:pimeloyl-ACP methyl ester carboxylesterase
MMLSSLLIQAAEPAGGNVAKPVMLKSVYGEMPLPAGCREGIFPLRTAKRIELKLPSGQAAYLILPTKAPPQGVRPWVLYAPHTMGDTWIWERLLDSGFAIAAAPGVAEWLGKPEARQVVTELYDVATKEFGLDKQVCLMPQSRGGLLCYNWAEENPDKVRCIGGIYPVLDMMTYPAGPHGPEVAPKTYGMTREEFEKRLPENNPIERLAPLAKQKIPIFHVHGDKDGPVPAKRNSLEAQERYRAFGGEMEVEIVPGKGHEECPEIFHSQKLVDFFVLHGLRKSNYRTTPQ